MTGAAAVRSRQLPLLVRPTLRAVRWQPLPVSVLLCVLLLWWQDPASETPTTVLWVVRATALLLAGGVACALDDRSRATVSAVPATLRFRTTYRALLLVLPAAAVWVVLVAWVDARVDGALPALALSLEAAAVGAVLVAACAVLARWPGLSDPSVVAGPLLATFVLAARSLPAWAALVVAPGPTWVPSHWRWALLLAVALAALGAAVRDPAARGPAPLSRRRAAPASGSPTPPEPLPAAPPR